MLITYVSLTGNVERFVKKLPYEKILKIKTGKEIIDEPTVFITYTTGIGQIPGNAQRFCETNKEHIVAVAASGNINWGSSYGIAADKLSNMFGIPVLMKFEMSGRPTDVEKFIEGVDQLALHRAK